MKRGAEELSAVGVSCRFQAGPGSGENLLVGHGVVLTTQWLHLATNDIKHAKLVVEFWDAVPPRRGYGFTEPRRFEKHVFTFGLRGPDRPGWLDQNGKEYSSDHLAETMLKRFMDLHEEATKRRQ